ncbi:Hsp20/alpha crystallin family protein [Cognatiluteimonas weifangensis]|uniref:Hsp20/alpha crystallin family protein n=1 Tax=Cognatiluteimonas weifangensis TaxID=2303539 RepID=A0A372DML5_9GAMM|nr:Hsp20/alpha crystallin family protein [Luteimonas weifangensis]RFP60756.1 Hsp20/alpha crystallin family protein [Luteimonas weifangensis]
MAMPTRWNPVRQLSRLDPFTDIEDMFRNFVSPTLTRTQERALDMRLDVNEDDKNYFVHVDMPGLKKSDIDVAVEGNQVTISAEVNREKSQEKGKELYSERYSGQAYRAFTLPSEVDSTKAQANYDGGVLMLTLPKKAGDGSRHLTVS